MYEIKRLYKSNDEPAYMISPDITYSTKKPCTRKCDPYCDGFRCI